MKMIHAFTLLSLALILAGCGEGGTTGTESPGTEAELQAMLDEAVGSTFPGAMLRVSGSGLEFSGSAGFADQDSGEAFRTDHLFHAGSAGKMFVGMAAAHMVHNGVLNLEGFIDTWLPMEIATRIPGSQVITLRDLLQQTSGLVDVLNSGLWEEALGDNPEMIWTNRALAELVLDLPLDFEPGSQFAYSNTNYILLGIILEEASGRPVHELLREWVFDPLGMDSTSTPNHEPLAGEPAHAYVVSGGQSEDLTELILHWEASSGGQWSTLEDLTRYFHGAFGSASILDEQIAGRVLEASEHFPYGLGHFVVPSPYGTMIGHGGIFLGFHTTTGFFPDHDLSIVLNVNGYDGGPEAEELFVQVRDLVFAEIQ